MTERTDLLNTCLQSTSSSFLNAMHFFIHKEGVTMRLCSQIPLSWLGLNPGSSAKGKKADAKFLWLLQHRLARFSRQNAVQNRLLRNQERCHRPHNRKKRKPMPYPSKQKKKAVSHSWCSASLKSYLSRSLCSSSGWCADGSQSAAKQL